MHGGVRLPAHACLQASVATPAALFSYDPPYVASISPSSGRTVGGYPITVFGKNFGALGQFALIPEGGGPVAAADIVLSTSMISYNDSQMVFLLPRGIGANRRVFVVSYPVAGEVTSLVMPCKLYCLSDFVQVYRQNNSAQAAPWIFSYDGPVVFSISPANGVPQAPTPADVLVVSGEHAVAPLCVCDPAAV